MSSIREPKSLLDRITDTNQERNIYVHPSPLARDIFWQRLELLAAGLKQQIAGDEKAIDLGGGSGAFLRGLCALFAQVEVIDLDPQDAVRLADHYGIQNCRIHRGDISAWKPEAPVDVVVATDVLEHFAFLDVPIRIIKSYLKPDGLLAISVPTENWLYLLGRIIVRKTKPADHFHAGEDVLRRLAHDGFQIVWKSHAPRYAGVGIPLFRLAILRKSA